MARRYWYAWDSQIPEISVKLTQPNGVSRSLAGTAYQTMYHFMVGWSPLGCAHTPNDTWACHFYKNGKRAAGVWNASRAASVRVPSWARKQLLLDGRLRSVRPNAWMNIGSTPILFRSY